MILDEQVPTADPGELIIQYTPLIHKIAQRYYARLERLPSVDLDDLLQAGRIAIYNCQHTYDPAGGASFLTYAFDRIRSAMSRTMGLRSDGTLPTIPESLDESLSEDGDDTRLDHVPDTALTAEERIVEQDTHNETAEAVHAAVDRLKNAKQREVITRCWFDGQERSAAADDMGIMMKTLYSIETAAKDKLRRDYRLKHYAIPLFHVGVNRFRSTWTSAVEKAVIWKERQLYPELYKEWNENE